jgi:hypothetical protein
MRRLLVQKLLLKGVGSLAMCQDNGLCHIFVLVHLLIEEDGKGVHQGYSLEEKGISPCAVMLEVLDIEVLDIEVLDIEVLDIEVLDIAVEIRDVRVEERRGADHAFPHHD